MFCPYAISITWNYTTWEMKTASGFAKVTAPILGGRLPCVFGKQAHTRKTSATGSPKVCQMDDVRIMVIMVLFYAFAMTAWIQYT